MARQNPSRSIGGEANLADRIERELAGRGWSPADLADKLSAVGCPIQTSAIYKIVKGDPPRRITVDELLGLATVFETTPEDLLTPVELLDKQRAQELLKRLDESDKAMFTAISTSLSGYVELLTMSIEDRDLFDYVRGHRYTSTDVSSEALFEVVGEDGTNLGVPDGGLRQYLLDFESGLMEIAGDIAVAFYRNKKGLDSGEY